jgi:lysophospholipase L1-like esterase
MPIITSDTFTDTPNTLLESHTGSTGATWTKNPAFSTGSAAISSASRLRGNATNAVYYSSGSPSSADYDVEADFYVASPSGAAGITLRMSASLATYYLLDYEGPSSAWHLYTVLGGSTINVITFTQSLTTGQSYHVRLAARGSQITAYVDGVQIISISDTSIPSAGHPGLFFSQSDTDSTGYHLDNFAASSPVNVPLTDPNLFFSPYNWSGNGTGAPLSNNLPASTALAKTNTPGAYLKFNISSAAGGFATLLLDTSSLNGITPANCPTLAISIDGQAFTTPLLAYATGTTRLNLSTNLPSGSHTFLIYFRSITQSSPTASGDRWNTPASAVTLTGLELDGKGSATSAPTIRPKRLLVYGDSITEACNAVGSSNNNPDQDSTQSYAHLLASALSAEVGIVAFSAQGFSVTGYGNVPKLYNTTTPSNSSFDKFFSGTSRLFTGALSPAPDYILILEGTNDAGFGASDPDVTTSLNSLLPALRSAAGPTTHIFLTIPFAGYKRSPITSAFNSQSDPKLHLLDLGPDVASTLSSSGINTNDSLHPNTRGHATFASNLLSQITPLISSTTSTTFQASTGSYAV